MVFNFLEVDGARLGRIRVCAIERGFLEDGATQSRSLRDESGGAKVKKLEA